jgi:hypothetical protein
VGGVGSGGFRVGAGRKKKNQTQHWLGGDAGKRGHGKKDKKVAPPADEAVEVIAPPWVLEEPVRNVWESLAPHACAARTLTAATTRDFRDLCELIVDLDSARVARRQLGWTDEGIRMATAYRGLVSRVEAKMRAFKLAPIGKEMATETAAPADPFAEFDNPGGVQ